MRINHNISSLNTQRQLGQNTRTQAKNLEKLSSGLKINRAADGPASLVISEKMRAQISGLSQAIDNSESGVSLIQTAEAALDEVSRTLISARQVAIHAANDAVNDPSMLEADQQEINNVLNAVDRISQYTQFGTKQLLDGSRGASGVAAGENLEFVSATTDTKASQISGYKVQISQAATRSSWKGSVALTQDMIDKGEIITVTENGKTVSYTTQKGESVESNLNTLAAKMRDAGLDVDLLKNNEDKIELRHKNYGSDYAFSVASSTAGILSKVANVREESIRGQDVAGRINGEEATGRGQVLTGKDSSTNVRGLSVLYTGTAVDNMQGPEAEQSFTGTVSVAQNSLVFQIGGNVGQQTSFSLSSINTKDLATGLENKSTFNSLRDIDVRTFQGAQDSIRFLDDALEKIASTRGDLGAFQKNNLESQLNYLRIAHENLTNAESVLRDADMASEMSVFTKNQIMMQSATAMLAQANQTPGTVLQLLS